MSEQVCEQLTLFQGDSPASRLVLPGSEEARRMTVTSGRKCLELYRKSGPVGLLAKMLLESSIWRSTRCFLTWKTSDTPARRLLFRLVPSTPRTAETESQLWLGTPTAGTGTHGRSEKWREGKTPNPQEFVRMYPTPTRFDAACGDLKGKEYTGTRHAMKLIQAAKLWPTPKASDYKGSGPAGSKSAEHDLQKGNLKGIIMHATPQARDYRTGQRSRWEIREGAGT